MQSYEIKHMIVDDDFNAEESVTTNFSHNNQEYSITFDKGDFEVINQWVFENGTLLPANLSDELIEAIREDVKSRLN
ncbi:hypothetical protein [Alkalihalobacterium alkalinitrilicum]|uniref:hypothetical protein n=1 Tax=Alkalihalobacterium alkalinitrilicum TaxID=427920 RepID=UPI00114FDBCC|nr:hypothetical protein [Alkalihalobacterium alkalinitrilicum]